MLTRKYYEEFLKEHDKRNDKKGIINTIFLVEEETGIELLEWKEEQICSFLSKFNSTTRRTLGYHLSILRKFANFIADKEQIERREYEISKFKRDDYIDKKQLLSITLSFEQYTNIKNQLDITENGKEINVRDKLIFELAWFGLTNTEIKLLKIDDIEFVDSGYGYDAAILDLHKGRTVRIDDEETVEDIKLCFKEVEYISEDKNGHVFSKLYKNSNYLIKPIESGAISKNKFIGNPLLTLQWVLKRKNITCEGIDIEKLTIASIRNSRIIYLLNSEGDEAFTKQDIAGIYDFKNQGGLNWYKVVAKLKYENTQD